MQLLQWLIPVEGNGWASAITRREARALSLPGVGAERRRGPIAELPDLPLPLTVGRPPDEPPGDGPPVRVLQMALALVAEGEGGGRLLGEDEDDVGLLSLFAEYAGALARLLDALELPLDFLAPAERETLAFKTAPLEGWGARRAAWTLLLVAGAADVLASARGFRVGLVRVKADDGPWLDANAALPDALGQGETP